MHLKLLLSLLTFFFMTDNGGSGDGDGEGDEEGGDTAGGNGNAKGASDKPEDAGDDDVAGLKSALKAERTKAKNADRDLKTTRAELETIKNAGKSDEERRDADLKNAQARADAAEQQLRSERAERSVLAAARTAYANDPEAILALALPKLDFDDDGTPSNVDAILAALKKERPDRFKAAAGGADGAKQTSEARDIKPGLDRMIYAYDTQSKSAPRPR